MIGAKEFMDQEIKVALGDFRYHYDVEAIFDELYDKGFVVGSSPRVRVACRMLV